MGTNILIDIYSDVVCPWCYVGKRRLERALDRLKNEIKACVIWRPFQLNPTMPAQGMDRIDYLETKFGSVDAFRMLEEHVSSAGEEEGIVFAFDKIARTPNTFLAHRLIWFARQKGVQDVVIDALFKGYFEEGADIGRATTLAGLARRAGLDADSFLQSEDGMMDVKAEERAGHRLGIRGVPHFVVNRAYALSGAQPPDQFVAALRKVAMAEAERKAGV